MPPPAGKDPRFALRPAGPPDAAALDAVLWRSYAQRMAGAYDDAVLRRALPLIARANPDLLAGRTYYLAVGVGRPGQAPVLGAGGWSFERPGSRVAEPGLAHIRHFAVAPEASGAGIGTALFAQCSWAARAAGATGLEVYASLNAVGFYARMGFDRIAEVAIPLAPKLTLPAVLMRQDI